MSVGISKGMFVGGIVIAILASSLVASVVSMQLARGPQGPKGDTGATGAQGLKGDPGIPGESKMELGVISAPAYDSGWLNITDKRGQYFTLYHGLNTSEVLVDIRGRQEPDLTNYILWSNTYGGLRANTAVQTSDKGYAIAGLYSQSAISLVKINSTGVLQWNKTYSLGDCEDRSAALVKTNDGGFAITGSHFTLAKTDALGNMLWNKAYVQFPFGYANSLVQTNDGGFAIAGSTSFGTSNSTDFAIVKTDVSGNFQWSRTYNVGNVDHACSIIQVEDGGYALIGYTASSGWQPRGDFLLVKTDSNGIMQWSKTYGGSDNDVGYSLVQAGEGGYAIAGSGFANLIKTDSSGNLLWSQSYGGVTNSLIRTLDGGYALSGEGFTLVKTDASGDVQWSQTYRRTGTAVAYSLIQTGDSEYLLAGSSFWVAMVNLNRQQDVEHQMNSGLDMVALTNNILVLYRSGTDNYWCYVQVRIWKVEDSQ